MDDDAAHTSDLTKPAATPTRTDGYLPIGDYGAIGDGNTLALVGRDGSIDWMCAPELDSPSIFGAVIDAAAGGRFSLAPAIPYESEHRYVERSNVLETTFHTAEGDVRVTDAVSRSAGQRAPWRELLRRVEGLSGRVPMEWRVEPRFDYGRQTARVEPRGDALVLSAEGGGRLRLALCPYDAGEPSVAHGAASARFEVAGGARSLLVLTASAGGTVPVPARDAAESRLDGTVDFWQRFVARHRYEGRWRESVERSVLALALLADGRTGAIAAAGTTSLPEALGKPRNFDYRFAWVRDLSFTLEALLRLGYEELVDDSVTWMLEAVSHTHPRVNAVYRLDGEVLGGQTSLSLPGYRLTPPVHVGNQATSQLQLGGWGDFFQTFDMYLRRGNQLHPETGERLADMANLLCHLWRNEDAGLWELSSYADYATSKIGCWLTFDRVLRFVDDGHVPARNVAGWRAAREQVSSYIEQRLWSEQKRSYLQKAGSEALDTGCLLAARRGYADPRGERMNGTIDAIRRELDAGGPLLYRYSGMQEKENAFLACSF